LILVFGAGILVGAVIYFSAAGWIPYLDQRIFQPIDANQAQIQELLDKQQALQDEISSIQEALDSGSGTGIEATLGAIGLSMTDLTNDINDLQSAVNTNTYLSGTLIPGMLATQNARQESFSRNLSAIATAQRQNFGFRQELALIRILEVLLQANQYLLHDNYGLAEDNLETARDILNTTSESVTAQQRIVLLEMLTLIEGAITDLPSRPSLAGEKIQLAWQLGINGLPTPDWIGQSGTLTPTPYIDPSITATPTPN
jgi:hypothetical protein